MKLLHCDRCDWVMTPNDGTVFPAPPNTESYVIKTHFYEQGRVSDICQICKRKLLAYAIDNQLVDL